jgi:two-component system sensor histidine kinase BaeS
VVIEPRHECVTVRVWNRGTPIAPRERSRVFDRFYRGTEAPRVAPGSGLGLYVARKIAQAHGGTLELECDDTPGSEGVTFSLSIPLAKSDADGSRQTGLVHNRAHES